MSTSLLQEDRETNRAFRKHEQNKCALLNLRNIKVILKDIKEITSGYSYNLRSVQQRKLDRLCKQVRPVDGVKYRRNSAACCEERLKFWKAPTRRHRLPKHLKDYVLDKTVLHLIEFSEWYHCGRLARQHACKTKQNRKHLSVHSCTRKSADDRPSRNRDHYSVRKKTCSRSENGCSSGGKSDLICSCTDRGFSTRKNHHSRGGQIHFSVRQSCTIEREDRSTGGKHSSVGHSSIRGENSKGGRSCSRRGERCSRKGESCCRKGENCSRGRNSCSIEGNSCFTSGKRCITERKSCSTVVNNLCFAEWTYSVGGKTSCTGCKTCSVGRKSQCLRYAILHRRLQNTEVSTKESVKGRINETHVSSSQKPMRECNDIQEVVIKAKRGRPRKYHPEDVLKSRRANSTVQSLQSHNVDQRQRGREHKKTEQQSNSSVKNPSFNSVSESSPGKGCCRKRRKTEQQSNSSLKNHRRHTDRVNFTKKASQTNDKGQEKLQQEKSRHCLATEIPMANESRSYLSSPKITGSRGGQRKRTRTARDINMNNPGRRRSKRLIERELTQRHREQWLTGGACRASEDRCESHMLVTRQDAGTCSERSLSEKAVVDELLEDLLAIGPLTGDMPFSVQDCCTLFMESPPVFSGSVLDSSRSSPTEQVCTWTESQGMSPKSPPKVRRSYQEYLLDDFSIYLLANQDARTPPRGNGEGQTSPSVSVTTKSAEMTSAFEPLTFDKMEQLRGFGLAARSNFGSDSEKGLSARDQLDSGSEKRTYVDGTYQVPGLTEPAQPGMPLDKAGPSQRCHEFDKGETSSGLNPAVDATSGVGPVLVMHDPSKNQQPVVLHVLELWLPSRLLRTDLPNVRFLPLGQWDSSGGMWRVQQAIWRRPEDGEWRICAQGSPPLLDVGFIPEIAWLTCQGIAPGQGRRVYVVCPLSSDHVVAHHYQPPQRAQPADNHREVQLQHCPLTPTCATDPGLRQTLPLVPEEPVPSPLQSNPQSSCPVSSPDFLCEDHVDQDQVRKHRPDDQTSNSCPTTSSHINLGVASTSSHVGASSMSGAASTSSHMDLDPASTNSQLKLSPTSTSTCMNLDPASATSDMNLAPASRASHINIDPAPTTNHMNVVPAPRTSCMTLDLDSTSSCMTPDPSSLSSTYMNLDPLSRTSSTNQGLSSTTSHNGIGPASAAIHMNLGPASTSSHMDLDPASAASCMNQGSAASCSHLDVGADSRTSHLDLGFASTSSHMNVGPAPTNSHMDLGLDAVTSQPNPVDAEDVPLDMNSNIILQECAELLNLSNMGEHLPPTASCVSEAVEQLQMCESSDLLGELLLDWCVMDLPFRRHDLILAEIHHRLQSGGTTNQPAQNFCSFAASFHFAAQEANHALAVEDESSLVQLGLAALHSLHPEASVDRCQLPFSSASQPRAEAYCILHMMSQLCLPLVEVLASSSRLLPWLHCEPDGEQSVLLGVLATLTEFDPIMAFSVIQGIGWSHACWLTSEIQGNICSQLTELAEALLDCDQYWPCRTVLYHLIMYDGQSGCCRKLYNSLLNKLLQAPLENCQSAMAVFEEMMTFCLVINTPAIRTLVSVMWQKRDAEAIEDALLIFHYGLGLGVYPMYRKTQEFVWEATVFLEATEAEIFFTLKTVLDELEHWFSEHFKAISKNVKNGQEYLATKEQALGQEKCQGRVSVEGEVTPVKSPGQVSDMDHVGIQSAIDPATIQTHALFAADVQRTRLNIKLTSFRALVNGSVLDGEQNSIEVMSSILNTRAAIDRLLQDYFQPLCVSLLCDHDSQEESVKQHSCTLVFVQESLHSWLITSTSNSESG